MSVKRLLMVSCVALCALPIFADDGAPAPDPLDTGFGRLEARAYKPILPDLSLQFGAGVAMQVGVIPDGWPLLSPLLGGRRLFADWVLVEGQNALGASISLKRAEVDDGARLFAVIWKEDDFEASAGFAYGWNVDLADLF